MGIKQTDEQIRQEIESLHHKPDSITFAENGYVPVHSDPLSHEMAILWTGIYMGATGRAEIKNKK